MKKILLLTVGALVSLSTFAFEGVINQTYTDIDSKEQKTFIWTIANENVKLEIVSGEERMTIIPDFKNQSILLYGNKADNEGNFWYMNTPLTQLQVVMPKLKLLETKQTDFKGEAAEELKLISDKGLLMVQFLYRIDINTAKFANFFAESREFSAILLADNFGFPVSSMVITQDEAINTLSTNSITEQKIDLKVFNIPANYKLYTTAK